LGLGWRREVVKTSVRALLSAAVTEREKWLTEIGTSRRQMLKIAVDSIRAYPRLDRCGGLS
jgi:hypothetical protein